LGFEFSERKETSFFSASLDPARPRDPINDVCFFTGKSISENHFTYHSVQTFKILFEGFYFPQSDPPHKIMPYWFYYSTQLVV